MKVCKIVQGREQRKARVVGLKTRKQKEDIGKEKVVRKEGRSEQRLWWKSGMVRGV